VKYGSRHRSTTAAGCRNSERSRVIRQRVALVIGALTRAGRADLVVPQAQDMGLARMLATLAASTNPDSPEGTALRQTMAKTPKALAAYCRRNRAWVSAQIAAATKDNAPGG
jgi:hypothetical protein